MLTMMPTEFFESFNAAIARPENRHEDGSINWDFVDADMWNDRVINNSNRRIAYTWFNELADDYERTI